jgi:hypothetical protein
MASLPRSDGAGACLWIRRLPTGSRFWFLWKGARCAGPARYAFLDYPRGVPQPGPRAGGQAGGQAGGRSGGREVRRAGGQADQSGGPVRRTSQADQSGRPVRPTSQADQSGRPVRPTSQADQSGRPVRPTSQAAGPGQVRKRNALAEVPRASQEARKSPVAVMTAPKIRHL